MPIFEHSASAHKDFKLEAAQQKADLTEYIASLEAGSSERVTRLSQELSLSEEEKTVLQHQLNEVALARDDDVARHTGVQVA